MVSTQVNAVTDDHANERVARGSTGRRRLSPWEERVERVAVGHEVILEWRERSWSRADAGTVTYMRAEVWEKYVSPISGQWQIFAKVTACYADPKSKFHGFVDHIVKVGTAYVESAWARGGEFVLSPISAAKWDRNYAGTAGPTDAGRQALERSNNG